MIFKITTISIIVFIATIINAFVTYASWQRRKSKGGIYFAYAMLALTFWTLADSLDYAAVSIPLKIFFAKLEALGYGSAIPLITALSISYAGNEKWLKQPWINFLMIFVPASSILLIWTNELHGWIWSGFEFSKVADNVLIFEHGPAFTWVTFTGYSFLVIALLNLVQASTSGTALSRRQARLLLLSMIVPMAGNVLYLSNALNTPGIDWSSITFSITGLLFLWALYGSRFLDIAPVARNTMIERMPDGVLVLDNMGYLVDFNPAAQFILGLQQDALWAPFHTALDGWPDISSLLENPTRPKTTEITIGNPEKFYELLLTPLEDNRNQVYGYLIVMRNITDHKQAEENLLQTQEQLISQQRELATLEARQNMARDLHDSVNQSIHSMVLFSETLTALIEKGNMGKVPYIADRLQESARQALKETRLLLYELQSSASSRDVDLIRNLENRLATVERRAGVSTQLNLKGNLDKCPQEWMSDLYWIAIEALNNALKYSQARAVKINIRCLPEQLELEIVDNGRGFEADDLPVGGMGLRSMRERASLLGGQLTINSAPGQGTSVRFSASIKE